MTPRPPHAISRRRALAPIAGLALAAAPLARTAAQPTQPGAAPLMTAQQKARLATALRYVRLARAQVNLAYPGSAPRRPARFIAALDAALSEGQLAAAGHWR